MNVGWLMNAETIEGLDVTGFGELVDNAGTTVVDRTRAGRESEVIIVITYDRDSSLVSRLINEWSSNERQSTSKGKRFENLGKIYGIVEEGSMSWQWWIDQQRQ